MKSEIFNQTISQMNRENEEKIKKIKSEYENKISILTKSHDEV